MAESMHALGGGHPTSGGAASGGGGGKVYTDFGEAGQALKHLDDAYTQLEEAWRNGQDMEVVKGPGNEPASGGYSSPAVAQGKQHRQDLKQYQNEIKEMRDSLQAHLESQRRTEETNAANHNSIMG